MNNIDHYKNGDCSVYKAPFKNYDIRKAENNSGNRRGCNSDKMKETRSARLYTRSK